MRFKFFIFQILFTVFFSSCQNISNQTLISGNIPNLPDGELYLYKDVSSNILDSVKTKDGKFSFSINLEDGMEEPIYLGLDHRDKSGLLRAFYYSTSSEFLGGKFNSQFFLSDSIIVINGSIKDFRQNSIKLSEKTKLVISPKIIAGYQTNAMFNTDGDLFNNIDKSTYNKVLSKIKKYPNSFHLLYQINNNRNSFSANQSKSLINSFKGEIVESKTFKTLKDYNEKRFKKKALTAPTLLNDKGKKTEILDTKYKKHLVIFWASWCGPCRQEIPSLKKMYTKYKNNIEFVSVSIDEKKSLWQKALGREQMPWKQLIVNEKSKDFEPIKILFQLSPSIPYIVLVDNKMTVIKSHVGLMNENGLEKFLKD